MWEQGFWLIYAVFGGVGLLVVFVVLGVSDDNVG